MTSSTLPDTHSWTVSLWDYAVALYQAPGVEQQCLQLQNRFGVNVNVLLWAAWLAHEEKTLSEPILDGAINVIQPLDDELVKPLRRMRNRVSDIVAPLPSDDLRQQLLSVELSAEKVVLEALRRYTEQMDYSEQQLWPDPVIAIEGNLNTYLSRFKLGVAQQDSVHLLQNGMAAIK